MREAADPARGGARHRDLQDRRRSSPRSATTGVEITGIGTAASSGLKKGIVVNIDATVEAIRKAVDEAELMAGCEIRSVVAGSAGSHIKGFNSHGVVAVKKPRGRAASDVERVIDAARAVALPDRSRGPARPAAGVRRRRPGRHQGAGRHDRRAARGARPHRDRRDQLGAEPHQVLQPRRAASCRTCSAGRSRRPRRCSRRRSASSAWR